VTRKWQYENKFGEWDFKKNQGGASKWRITKCCLEKRTGKSEVYIDGVLKSSKKR
jgi:hypothetical protein